jgi:hypothetical protein
MEIRLAGEVIEFIFGPSKRIVFNDEGQPGLEGGRDNRSKRIVAYMSLNFVIFTTAFSKASKKSRFSDAFP